MGKGPQCERATEASYQYLTMTKPSCIMLLSFSLKIITTIIRRVIVMKKQTIAIFGGSNEMTYKKIGKKMNCKVLFHNGKTRNGGVKKDFKNLVKNSDCVVVLLGAIGHVSMDVVKSLSKEYGKPLVFQQGFGASMAIQRGLEQLKVNKAA